MSEKNIYPEGSSQELEQLAEFLQSKLQRGTPPTTQQLGEYALGLLSAEENKVVEQFLSDFPNQQYNVNEMRAYLKGLEGDLPESIETPTIGQRVKMIVAQLVPDRPINPKLESQYRTQGQDEKPKIYEAGNLHISLDVLNDSERPDRRSLLGLVIGPDVEGYDAYLWRTESAEKIDSVEVTDAGNFIVSGLEPDRYDLILDGPQMVVVEGFEVGG